MRVCLVSAPGNFSSGIERARRLAELLATRHEVTLIHSGEAAVGEEGGARPAGGVREVFARASAELAPFAFSCEEHRRSAAVLEAIEGAYEDGGPDYVEAHDRRAAALVPVLARRGCSPLLRESRFAVRLVGSAELTCLHDGTIARPGIRRVSDLEREQLRLADRVVWPGGDGLGLYGRHHDFPLPEALAIGEPLPQADPAPRGGAPDGDRPLRILYLGALQRGKGAQDLAEACLRLAAEDWSLTMIGMDTPTAAGGQSMWMTVEQMFGEDPRLTLEEPPPREDLHRRLADHDLLVTPSTFDVWPVEVLEAMAAGLPVLATPVGGLVEMVEPGVSGWLTEDVGPVAIRRGLERLLSDRGELEEMREGGGPVERVRRLTDPERILAGYDSLFEQLGVAKRRKAPARRAAEPPLVTGVIPYYRASAHVEEALDSLLAQTHPNVEAILVNDGSFEQADEILLRLAERDRVRVVTQLNGGEPAARNLGICLARGDHVVMLDADNALEPEFVSRALEVFEREPGLAYVSCWLRFVIPDGSFHSEPAGYAPLGNAVVGDDVENWDGDALAMLPRRLFSEAGYRFEVAAATHSDWELYRRLREDGRFGTVIPECLARYRVLPASLMRALDQQMQDRAWDESLSRRMRRATRWTAEG